ncbi:unnamed protein product [Chrysodeixis includens]|uniref:Uncharacterized protein n=1 Tax=Chrysodeixis includens TaxID=689277 RepID=A0A9P0C6I6_CHRIL|nr:unnamed protein product [Chrysodeixis includens]
MPFCSVCKIDVTSRTWFTHLRTNEHKNNSIVPLNDNIEIIDSCFKGRIASYRIKAYENNINDYPESFLISIRKEVKSLIDNSLQKHTSVKVNFDYYGIFLLYKNDVQELKSFATKNIIVHCNYDFDSLYQNCTVQILKKVEEFQERDSGWSFLHNSHLEININKYQPLSGSKFLDLPKFIKSKKACLNIQNNDDYCFLWCIVAALYPVARHSHRVTSYPHFRDVLNIGGIAFPISFSDINIFERNNPAIQIYIYGLRNGKTITGPLYRPTKLKKGSKTIHLLFLENDNSSHFCLIKDLPRLVKSQITKHHSKLYFCETCLLFFPDQEKYNKHLCGGVVTVLPNKGSVIQFKNYQRKQDVPFVIYADFETLLEQVSNHEHDTANTLSLQRHVPTAFAYNIVSSMDDNFNEFKTYRGIDCVSKFIDFLTEDVKRIHKILTANVRIKFSQKR